VSVSDDFAYDAQAAILVDSIPSVVEFSYIWASVSKQAQHGIPQYYQKSHYLCDKYSLEREVSAAQTKAWVD